MKNLNVRETDSTVIPTVVYSDRRERVPQVYVETVDEFWNAIAEGKHAIIDGAYDCIRGETLKDGAFFVTKSKHTGARFRSEQSAKRWVAKRLPTLK